MYAPAGVHVDAEYTTEDKDEEDFTGEEPFAYPMGIGGVMMNGCYVSKLKQIAAKLLEMITRFQILNTKFAKIFL